MPIPSRDICLFNQFTNVTIKGYLPEHLQQLEKEKKSDFNRSDDSDFELINQQI